MINRPVIWGSVSIHNETCGQRKVVSNGVNLQLSERSANIYIVYLRFTVTHRFQKHHNGCQYILNNNGLKPCKLIMKMKGTFWSYHRFPWRTFLDKGKKKKKREREQKKREDHLYVIKVSTHTGLTGLCCFCSALAPTMFKL